MTIACSWVYLPIIRHSRRALNWALILTGLITPTDVATLVLVKFRLNGYDDYPIQFDDMRTFIPLALN